MLRQTCYEGQIIMVTRDALPPFDKPKLSKVRTEEKQMHACFCLTIVRAVLGYIVWSDLFQRWDVWKVTALFRHSTWTEAAFSSAQLTFISSMVSRCGQRKRWGKKRLCLAEKNICLKMFFAGHFGKHSQQGGKDDWWNLAELWPASHRNWMQVEVEISF